MNSDPCLEQLGTYLVGATFKRVNVDVIKKYMTPVPPETEQAEIVRFLGVELLKHDTEVRAIRSSIALHAEYRSALITAAVTGQIEELR